MKKPSKKDVILEDSFVNAFANIGTSRDKQYHSTYSRDIFTPQFFETLYLSWAAGQIVDVPANDMTREWRTINAPSLSVDQMNLVLENEKNLKTRKKFQEGQKWARLYGGAIGVMIIENAGFPDEPLDLNRVGLGSFKHFNVYDRTEVVIEEIDRDPFSENYRKPLFYRINGSSQNIHFSRVLRFRGNQVSWQMQQNNQYWDYSILQRCVDPIQKFDTVYNAMTSMVFEANVDIISVENLFEKLSQPGGKKALQTRFAEGALLKSINNMLLLDSRETYDRKTQTFAGLPDLFLKTLGVLAAAADIPATRLLGQSPGGLNATGESDLENYYTRIAADQNEFFSPNLDVYDDVFTRSIIGYKPDDWSYEYNSLWSVSDLDRAEIGLKDSNRDKNYLDTGVVTPSIVASSLKENNVYSIDDEYLEALKELDFDEIPDDEVIIENVEKESTEENQEDVEE